MSKAERLFQLVSILRGRRSAITAEALAETLEVSVRTVYRDLRALVLSGLPIEGEAGIGYLIRPGHHLPPLMFTPDEVQALIVGSRMVQALTDRELGLAARRVEDKVRSVLTEPLKAHAERQPYRVPILQGDDHLREVHGQLRRACEQCLKVACAYNDANEVHSERTIWPLGIIGWSGRWTLLAWCELRQDYRNFRFDRFHSLTVTAEPFTPTAEISLAYYIRRIVGVRDTP